MNSKLIAFILFIALLATAPFVFNKQEPRILIGGKIVKVELAKTDEQVKTGLMNRDHLDANKGMLFIFPQPGLYPFWMKNTKIPLDIIWIKDNTIVDFITLQAETPDSTPQYTPKSPANYVLEANAGFIKENNIQVGDRVKIKY